MKLKTFLLSAFVAFSCLASAGTNFGKIMCVGDSLTDGAGEGTRGGGYRVKLCQMLDKAHAQFTMVGNNGTGSGPLAGTDRQWHEGNGGWSTQDVIDGRDGRGNLTDWLNQWHPDTIVLMIGQNDPWDWSDAYVKYKTLMDGVYAVSPNVRVYWSNVFAEADHNSFVMTKVTRLDTAIRQLVPYYQAQGKQISMMDSLGYMFNLTGTHDIYGVHLNDYGYDILGNFFAKNMLLGSAGWGGSLTPVSASPWPPQ